MKKFLEIGLCILIVVMMLAGCSCERGDIDPTEEATELVTEETDAEEVLLPIEESLDMIFSSGAGSWESHISINADGSFTGGYHDMDMGSMGDGYDVTVYESFFKGKFTNIEIIEDYAYTMTLESVETTVDEGTETIEEWDGVMVRTVASEAFGIAGGDKFIFYLPDTPVDVLDEGFMDWNPARGEDAVTLGRYGLYNVTESVGFFTYD